MTAKIPETALSNNLYEQDYYLWLKNTIKLLQEGALTELDIVNLIEELDDMGKRERRSVYSNLKILLMHLLKYRYQPHKRSNSWKLTIEEHRQRIEEAFEDSPSLKSYFEQSFDKCYQDARRLAAQETGLALDTFPAICPFSPEEVLDGDRLNE